MRKVIVLLIVLSVLFSACGNGNQAGTDNTNNQGQNQGTTDNNQNNEKVTKLEIVKKTGGAWKDSIGTVWVHSAALFKNTGDTPIQIGETQMNIKDKEGGILGTEPLIYSVPEVVMPGETAYIGETSMLEGINDPNLYKETTYNFNYDSTSDDPNLMEVSGVKGIKGDEYTPYKVTGVVKNITNQKQDDIRVAAGLYANDGTLLGVLNGSIDVGVNPGSEAGFELNYPEIPQNVVDKIASVDVKAYAWTF